MEKMHSGKGLAALINNNTVKETGNSQMIPMELIDPNPYQPRKEFKEEALNDLCQSIKKYGVIQPILLRKKGLRYEIVCGERRFRASKLAGLVEIPANVKEITNSESLEIAIIENIQREDINAIETALGYKRLIDEFSYTQEELSKIIGKSRSAIANTLRLLTLDRYTVSLIQDNIISEGHGRCVLSVPEDKRKDFTDKIIKGKLSVRQAEELAVSYKKQVIQKEQYIVIKPYISNARKLLNNVFDNVKISEKDNKGKIVISFNSEKELNKILSSIKEK